MAVRQVQKRVWRNKSPKSDELEVVRDASQSPQATSSDCNIDTTFVAPNQAEAKGARANSLHPVGATAAASAFRQMRSWMDGSEKMEEEESCSMLTDRHRLVNFDLEKETHYVLVIHGTFDAPIPGQVKWYQPDMEDPTNFCAALAHSFVQLGPACAANGNPVWRPLAAPLPPELEGYYPFHWDATNTHAGRLAAAERLAKLLHFIGASDPSARIHLLAHSHGGNVLLKAIEIYMNDLAKSDDSTWHPSIRRAFWSAYSNQHKLAFRWRRHKSCASVPWYQTLWPFLILYRSLAGEKARGCEAYPFAYYKWFDTFLGLGYVRQNIYLRHRKASSPVSNALGSLIFMGTPFLVKRWNTLQKILFFLSIVIESLVAGLLMYAYISFWYFIIVADHKVPRNLIANLIAGCTFVMLVFIGSLMLAFSDVVFWEGNIYHKPGLKWSSAMSTLVAHAGVLDEACMGLSAEPLVEATLVPKLQEVMEAPIWRSWPVKPEAWSVFTAIFYVCKLAYSLYINGMGLVPLVHRGIIKFLAPMFGNSLRKMALSIALGLKSKDLSFGRMFVCKELQLSNTAATQVQHWNTQRLIAAHHSTEDFRLQSISGEEIVTPGTIVRPRRARSRGRVRWGSTKSAIVARLRKAGSFKAASRASKSEGDAEAVANGTAGGGALGLSTVSQVSVTGSEYHKTKEMTGWNATTRIIDNSSSSRGLQTGDASIPSCGNGPPDSDNRRGTGAVTTASEDRFATTATERALEDRLRSEDCSARAMAMDGSAMAIEGGAMAMDGGSRLWLSRRVVEEENNLTSSLQQGSLDAALGRIERDYGHDHGSSMGGIARSISRVSGRLGFSGRVFSPTLKDGVRRGSEHVSVKMNKAGSIAGEALEGGRSGNTREEEGGVSEWGSGREGDRSAGSAVEALESAIGDRPGDTATLAVSAAVPTCRAAAAATNNAAAGATATQREPVQKEEMAGLHSGRTGPMGSTASDSVAVNIESLEARESDTSAGIASGGMGKEEEESGGMRKGEGVEGGREDGPSSIRELVALLEQEGQPTSSSVDGQARGTREGCGGDADEAVCPARTQLQAVNSRKLRSELEGRQAMQERDSGGAGGLPTSVGSKEADRGVPLPIRAQERMPRESSEDAFFRRREALLERLESVRRAEQEPGKEYSFLWNDADLEKLASKSKIFCTLEDKVASLTHDPDLTEEQFERELKLISVMFEKRVREFTGHYNFSHSVYHKNRILVHALANFLVTWDLPPWADEEQGIKDNVKILQ